MKRYFIKLFERYYEFRYLFMEKKEIDYKKEFKKIALVLTFPLGFGDLIMMGPLIKSFRKNFPYSKIHLITDRNIYEKIDEVDEIKIVNGGLVELKSDFKKLSSEKYDLAVVMARAVNQSFYVDFLRPRFKLGYLASYKILSNFKLKKENLVFDKKIHFSFNSLKILESLGFNDYDLSLIYVDYGKEIRDKVKHFYNKLGFDKNKKVICFNLYSIWKTRRWDENNYVELGLKLKDDFNIILFGGPDGKELNALIEKEFIKKGLNVFNISGKLSLKESIYFLSLTDMLVTADSGPMHFAFSVGIPTICFFGPVRPEHRLPLENSKNNFAFWAGNYGNYSEYDYESEHKDERLSGLKMIKVDDVYLKIVEFFGLKK